MKLLVVNADDFGFCPAVNRGVVRAHVEGIVTSASLMVRWPAAEEAAEAARKHPRLSLGLHIDLGEWVHTEDGWAARYVVAPITDEVAVRAEIERQLDQFLSLTGSPPTHLDSHQHVHRREPVASVLGALGRELDVPVRHTPQGITYRGDFYGQSGTGTPHPEAIRPEALAQFIDGLTDGATEMVCHPAEGGAVDSVYGVERSVELESLCDERVRVAVSQSNIRLISFGELDRWRSEGCLGETA